ncbi:uncharacterized protein [Diadema setosum]|uniref:uncharacterized protein n=1 Tax=Diadema setosum TaxID=31175 RepID=UPI003B3A20C9
MATNFRKDDDTDCEGCHSKTKSHITYRREVHERLCDDCARERQDTIKGVVRKIKWVCGKHDGEEAKLYCKSHEIPICLACALTNHHEACQKHDIQDVTAEKQDQLMKMLQEGRAKKENIECFTQNVSQHYSHINSYLRMIERQIRGREEEERKKILCELDEKRAKINNEAEENIRKINEERKKLLEKATNDAEESSHEGKRNAEALLLELGKIKGIIVKLKVKLQTELQDMRDEISGAIKKAEDLIIEENRLLRDVTSVSGLLNQCIKTKVNLENISQIRQKVERIKFKLREGLEIGQLDGMDDEECVLHDTWEQPAGTAFIGLISNHEVLLHRDNSLFVANTNARTITPVKIQGTNRVRILSVARLHQSRLVAVTPDGNLLIFHRHSSNPDHDVVNTWLHVRPIRTKCGPFMFLNVDKNGLILTACLSGSTIDIYNPENGNLVQTVKLTKDACIIGFSSMSSGLIGVLSNTGGKNVIYVVDMLLGIKSTIHLDDYEGRISGIAIDGSDDIYLTYYNSIKQLYVVDVLSSTGAKISEAIIECPDLPKLVTTLPKRLTVFHDLTVYSYERKSFMDFLNALML